MVCLPQSLRARADGGFRTRGASQALLLAVNESGRAAEVLWAWPPPRSGAEDGGFFHPIGGDVDLLPSGTVAVVSAPRPKKMERLIYLIDW